MEIYGKRTLEKGVISEETDVVELRSKRRRGNALRCYRREVDLSIFLQR